MTYATSPQQTSPSPTSLDYEREKIETVISPKSRFTGEFVSEDGQGIAIEGIGNGTIDVGQGTVVIGKGGEFSGSIRAGKLINMGRLLKHSENSLAEISGDVVLGSSCQQHVDLVCDGLTVQPGAHLDCSFKTNVKTAQAAAATGATSPSGTGFEHLRAVG